MDRPAISVVVPCFNEEEVLPELYRRVTAACLATGLSHEIVLVNDGSKDRTWPLMTHLAGDDPRVVGVNLSRNHGHQLALLAGLTICRGGRVLILDADLQDPPELLGPMLARMDAGADVVYGQRRRRDGESAFKTLTASLFYRLMGRLTDVPIPRDTGDFRLLSRRALDVLLSMNDRHPFIRGMVSWIGFRQDAFPYDRLARFAGTTKYPLRKMIRFALDAITAFSVKPLALASYVGMISGVFALGLLGYSLGSYLGFFPGRLERGWTSLMSAMALLGSVQLIVLGIIGEYLGRMYEQVKGRPRFVIQEIARADDRGRAADGENLEGPRIQDETAS